MTSLANAFRKAMGQPENNNLPIVPVKVDKKEETFFGLDEIEIINKHGFKELGFWSNNHWFPICTNCGSHTTVNRGQGTECDNCTHEAISHMVHDTY